MHAATKLNDSKIFFYILVPSQNLVAFAGGGLEGRLVLSRPLDYETMPKFNVTLRVKDQGTPPLYSDTNLQVQVCQ